MDALLTAAILWLAAAPARPAGAEDAPRPVARAPPAINCYVTDPSASPGAFDIQPCPHGCYVNAAVTGRLFGCLDSSMSSKAECASGGSAGAAWHCCDTDLCNAACLRSDGGAALMSMEMCDYDEKRHWCLQVNVSDASARSAGGGGHDSKASVGRTIHNVRDAVLVPWWDRVRQPAPAANAKAGCLTSDQWTAAGKDRMAMMGEAELEAKCDRQWHDESGLKYRCYKCCEPTPNTATTVSTGPQSPATTTTAASSSSGGTTSASSTTATRSTSTRSTGGTKATTTSDSSTTMTTGGSSTPTTSADRATTTSASTGSTKGHTNGTSSTASTPSTSGATSLSSSPSASTAPSTHTTTTAATTTAPLPQPTQSDSTHAHKTSAARSTRGGIIGTGSTTPSTSVWCDRWRCDTAGGTCHTKADARAARCRGAGALCTQGVMSNGTMYADCAASIDAESRTWCDKYKFQCYTTCAGNADRDEPTCNNPHEKQFTIVCPLVDMTTAKRDWDHDDLDNHTTTDQCGDGTPQLCVVTLHYVLDGGTRQSSGCFARHVGAQPVADACTSVNEQFYVDKYTVRKCCTGAAAMSCRFDNDNKVAAGGGAHKWPHWALVAAGAVYTLARHQAD